MFSTTNPLAWYWKTKPDFLTNSVHFTVYKVNKNMADRSVALFMLSLFPAF